MKLKINIFYWLMTLFMLLAATTSKAIDFTPEIFVVIDTEVRQMTITGMSERVNLLSSGTSTLQQENVIYENNRQQVTAIYAKYGTTVTEHTAYGTHNAKQIEQWLVKNPTWQGTYTVLENQHDILSAQLSSIGGN